MTDLAALLAAARYSLVLEYGLAVARGEWWHVLAYDNRECLYTWKAIMKYTQEEYKCKQ